MSGRDSGDWVKDRYASNLYRSAFLSNRLQTSLLMARTVAVMASRAANISTEERRTFDRFEAPTRKEPSPGTFAFGSMYSETMRSEEHTSELQSRGHLVCRLLLEKKKQAVHCE